MRALAFAIMALAVTGVAVAQQRTPPPEPETRADAMFSERAEPQSEASTVTFMAESRIVSLSPADAAAYRNAFAAAGNSDWAGMEAAFSGVGDTVLVGHLRARRLTATAQTPAIGDFVDWLNANRDAAVAESVRTRGLRLRQSGDPDLPPLDRGRGRRLPGAAQTSGASEAERAILRTIAERYYAGDVAGTRAAAEAAAGGALDADIAWFAGLSAFRLNDPAAAAAWFERANRPTVDAWQQTAAAWWAARAHLRAGNARGVLPNLERGTAWPTTFYGQLSLTQLGRATPLSFDLPTLDAAKVRDLLARYPNARRAAALAQLNRLAEAEAELRVLQARLGPSDDALFIAFAEALAAPGAQIRAAEFGGTAAAAGHCPYTAFVPGDGFRLDPAMIYAVTRQESRFSPTAISTSNAQGLMQLLPSTAAWMENDASLRTAPRQLHDPRLNMRLGQKYLEYLLAQPGLGRSLANVYAAYNGGPGFMQRWLATFPDREDPMLTLESIPRGETRTYAERVLAFTFLCREKVGRENPELDALAAGRPDVYQPPGREGIAALAPQVERRE
jgi:soluble lytic murein transglycosylase